MPHEVLEHAISAVFRSERVRDDIEFLWHAGEPLAAGLRHYEDALQLIEKHNCRGVEVRYSVQTNGTLVNEAWADFLFRNKFAVGLSIDGPARLHDRKRRSWNGRGTHKSVMRGYAALRQAGIRPGAICVLTADSLHYPDEIFEFFVDNGFHSVAFNVEEIENQNQVSSLKPAEGGDDISARYRSFMARMITLVSEHPEPLDIREFSDMVNVFRHKLEDEEYSRTPQETIDLGIVTIQKDGSISTFSPEFAGGKSELYNDFVIGNVMEVDSLDQLEVSDVYRRIKRDVFTGVGNCARSCLYFDLCGGAYVSNKFFENGSLQSTETTACRLHRQALAEVVLAHLTTATSIRPRRERVVALHDACRDAVRVTRPAAGSPPPTR